MRSPTRGGESEAVATCAEGLGMFGLKPRRHRPSQSDPSWACQHTLESLSGSKCSSGAPAFMLTCFTPVATTSQ